MSEDLDFHSPDLATSAEATGAAKFNPTEIGQHTSFDWTPEPLYLSDEVIIPDEFEDDPTNPRDTSPLSEAARNALMDLDNQFAKADCAPRRIEIEQAWRACHYERGYQFLLKHKNGGWTLPATGTGMGAGAQKAMSSVYHANVYGEKSEIIVAALCRETPKVEFLPANPEHAPDQAMSDVADDLKDIWAKNNDLMKIQQNVAKIFWNEDRCLLWTRFELNGEEYGYEEEDEPVVPEDEQKPPEGEIGDSEETQYQEENKSPVDAGAKRRPRGRVITTAIGKLGHKVPIYVDCTGQMVAISISEDKDEATAKAQFPWMSEKIRGGGDATGETELDRIARENVRQAVPGQYVTGDSINRHTVVKHTYLRRAYFWDAMVTQEVREELLAKFPDGVVLVKAATEFCFARNECIDDHCTVGHPFPGNGQNRRSLGESLLPIQDYINDMFMLALDFCKRTIAKKWMDSEAFDVETIRNQKNMPGAIGPFQRQPGVPVDQLIFIEPTPTPQPYMVTYLQWLITALTEQISGALPSLFGAQISGQVGSEGVGIQRDQALQRIGCPWNSIQAMFACAARQAVTLTAKCANKDINDVIPGRGPISVKLNNLKGHVLCYPEADSDIPESGSQREQKIMSLVDAALKSPDTPTAQLLLDPKNLKQIKRSLRLKGFTIKGESSVEKQEAELEILLRSGPVPNPKKAKMAQVLQQAQAGMQGAQASGQPIPPQAAGMVQQIQQAMQGLPDEVSTVPVRDDGSQDNTVEAGVLFDWMNSADGRKFANGNPQQQAAFQNVLLHWTEEKAAEQKLAPKPQPPQPKVSFSVPADKMPTKEQAEIMTAGGIPADPADFEQEDQVNQNREIQKKIVPDAAWASEAPGGQK